MTSERQQDSKILSNSPSSQSTKLSTNFNQGP
uniref:Uncharacterized protein n=1 Tax=Rhizophora mucronata TaxID=61149 RepID=A0A2P2P0K9_RHIMU